MRRMLQLGSTLILAVGCAGISEKGNDRWSGPLDQAKAREIVREAFSVRAHPNPHLDRPIPDHEVVSIDTESIEFREIGDPLARRQIVHFRDVTSISRQTTSGIPSRPESLLIHVAPGSESTRSADLRSDTLAWVGLRGPFLLLPERDRRLVRHFEGAMDYLRDQARRTGARSSEIEEFRRYLEAEQGRLEEEEEEEREARRHEERIERRLEKP